jgi:signal transduction histidine kinase
MLAISHDQPHYFTLHHAQLAQIIANQAAIAMENARLYDQARRLAAVEERQRLARDLHDSVSQALYGIELGAQTARELLGDAESPLQEPIEYIQALAQAGLAEMRALIFDLRPEALANEGLVGGLKKQAAFLRARHRLDVRAQFCDEPDAPLPVKEALYRVAQEALHNIVKHARARTVDIALAQVDGTVTLEIRDDGIGFDVNRPYPGHLGLASMCERIAEQRGELAVTSAPGSGTHIRAALSTQTARVI